MINKRGATLKCISKKTNKICGMVTSLIIACIIIGNLYSTKHIIPSTLKNLSSFLRVEKTSVSTNTYSDSKSISDTLPLLVQNTNGFDAELALLLLVFITILLVTYTLYSIHSKKAKENLAIEQKRYKALFEFTGDVLWEYSIQDDVLEKSDPDLGIRTGLAVTPNFGQFMRDNDIVFEDDMPIFESMYHDLRNGTEQFNYQFRAKNIAGNYQWFEINATTIYNTNKEPVVVLGQTTNIHKHKKALDEFHEAIDNDELTKVFNQEAIEHNVNNVLTNLPEDTCCALFVIDIDHYESINSRYGYVFGDALLLELATKLKRIYQNQTNKVGRVGTDEFSIFLANLEDRKQIEAEAKHMLKLISETFVTQENTNIITGCIGIAVFPNNGITYNELLEKADTALYHAKHMGENQYLIYEDTMPCGNYIAENASTTPILLTNKKYNYSLIDSQIIANTVEILSDAKDIESSINMILGIIGTFYSLCYIGILENSTEVQQGHITHEWRFNTSDRWNANILIPIEEMNNIECYNRKNNNCFSTNSSHNLESISPTAYNLATQNGITGLLQFNMYEFEPQNSYIVFCFNSPQRRWEQHETDTLQLLTKILSGHMLNLEAQKKANRLKKIDALTSCNNLTTFNEQALTLILENPSTNYVIFYSDIDKFKLFNQNYGYPEGDRILIEFAKGMQSIVDNDETFARISSDKFVGLFNYNNPKYFLGKLKALNDYMNSIPSVNGELYRISIIIGLCPVDNYRSMPLNIDQANMARKSITNRHKSRYMFFNEAMNKKLINQHEIEDQMELALQNCNFKIYYQPKFNLKTNKINGAEALVRWDHPTKGLIPPTEFIPIFEDNQFILKLDFYVFEEVCKHIQKLMDLGKEIYPVSVNFSRHHLSNNNMSDKLSSIISKYEVPPRYLEIELTESALQTDNNTMFTTLIRLHKMGFKISMDDFGSGLSSLNLLRTLPCDVLKLDKDFFQQGASTERERIVITMIVKMAQELHMTTVSEGVETEEQAEFLRSIHCDLAQGFLFSKPIPVEEYEAIYYNI